MIGRLIVFAYRRTNRGNLHVCGYRDEGRTTTPSDIEHLQYLRAHGEDMPEAREWQWPQ
jgi:xylulose-5-phosphate/fructose-6-phosphate phosphoketolase